MTDVLWGSRVRVVRARVPCSLSLFSCLVLTLFNFRREHAASTCAARPRPSLSRYSHRFIESTLTPALTAQHTLDIHTHISHGSLSLTAEGQYTPDVLNEIRSLKNQSSYINNKLSKAVPTHDSLVPVLTSVPTSVRARGASNVCLLPRARWIGCHGSALSSRVPRLVLLGHGLRRCCCADLELRLGAFRGRELDVGMVGTQRLAILDVEAYAMRPRAAGRHRALARAEAREAALLTGLASGAPVTRDERAIRVAAQLRLAMRPAVQAPVGGLVTHCLLPRQRRRRRGRRQWQVWRRRRRLRRRRRRRGPEVRQRPLADPTAPAVQGARVRVGGHGTLLLFVLLRRHVPREARVPRMVRQGQLHVLDRRVVRLGLGVLDDAWLGVGVG